MNTGVIGETIACRIIAGFGNHIIFRNFRTKFGEIDIVFKDKNGKLVFLEVKTLTNKNVCQIKPEDNVTIRKLYKMKKIAHWFANRYPEQIDEDVGWQIDVIAISLDSETGTYSYQYYENIG